MMAKAKVFCQISTKIQFKFSQHFPKFPLILLFNWYFCFFLAAKLVKIDENPHVATTAFTGTAGNAGLPDAEPGPEGAFGCGATDAATHLRNIFYRPTGIITGVYYPLVN
jgi:hypothetical protein